DPIGLGGGLNVYGFAAGDPVNFGDPFGLSCEGQWKDELAAVADSERPSQQGPPCGPILSEPGVKHAADRAWSKASASGVEYGENVFTNSSGKHFGLSVEDYLQQSDIEARWTAPS